MLQFDYISWETSHAAANENGITKGRNRKRKKRERNKIEYTSLKHKLRKPMSVTVFYEIKTTQKHKHFKNVNVTGITLPEELIDIW